MLENALSYKLFALASRQIVDAITLQQNNFAAF